MTSDRKSSVSYQPSKPKSKSRSSSKNSKNGEKRRRSKRSDRSRMSQKSVQVKDGLTPPKSMSVKSVEQPDTLDQATDVTQWEYTRYKEEAMGAPVAEDPNIYVVDKRGEAIPLLAEQKQKMLIRGEHLKKKPYFTLFFLFVQLILALTVLISWSFYTGENDKTPTVLCFTNVIILVIIVLIVFVIQFGRFNVIEESLDDDFRFRIPYEWKYWICLMHILCFFLTCSNITIGALDDNFDGGTIVMVSGMPIMLIISAGHVFFSLRPQASLFTLFVILSMDVNSAITKCEDLSDGVLRKTRKYLPTIGRLLLVSTFIEDGFRLLYNTSDHAQHFSNLWNMNYYFSYFLTVYMYLTLIFGSLMVMLRIKVPIASGFLASVVLAQVILYRLYTTYHLLTRNVSVLSALLLLVTENMLRKPKKYDPLPRDDNEVEVTSIMLVACRLFLNMMLVSMIHFDLSYTRLFLSVISYAMMVSLWCGYKTKMMSVLLATWLMLYNIAANDFWNRDVELHIIRYDFFQALSAVGGLLLLIHTGGGELSMDELKKKW